MRDILTTKMLFVLIGFGLILSPNPGGYEFFGLFSIAYGLHC